MKGNVRETTWAKLDKANILIHQVYDLLSWAYTDNDIKQLDPLIRATILSTTEAMGDITVAKNQIDHLLAAEE